MFWTNIARFLQHFINLFNSFINILAILQNFNEIFSKYSLNITLLLGINCYLILYVLGWAAVFPLKWPRLLVIRMGHQLRPWETAKSEPAVTLNYLNEVKNSSLLPLEEPCQFENVVNAPIWFIFQNDLVFPR